MGPSKNSNRQRVGIFNEVCPHLVHPATSARESASLPGFDLRLLGLLCWLPESVSSEVAALPDAPAARWPGEEARARDGGGSRHHGPELGRPPVELKRKEKQNSKWDVEGGKNGSEAARKASRSEKEKKAKGS